MIRHVEQYKLGHFHFTGAGVNQRSRDPLLALSLWQKAAEEVRGKTQDTVMKSDMKPFLARGDVTPS
jgi:hypothetical protein